MLRYTLIVIFLSILLTVSPTWSQEESETKIELSKTTFGLNIGTGFFQNINLNLTNFNQEILTTSDNLIPINFKAHFSYYLTPNWGVRFSSGYGYSRQRNHHEVDYSKVSSTKVKFEGESKFSASGFPTEIALIFQTPVDVRANMFVHFGLGLGYYVYNYKAEGIAKVVESETNGQQFEENYSNPEMTLSGGAQFFIFGFDINVSPSLGVTLETSKVGLSLMKLTRDIVTQTVDAGEVAYEKEYGYQKKDYAVGNGLDDLAISLGIYWQL